VENHGRACTQVLFLRKAELGFLHFLKIVTVVGTFSSSQDPITALDGTFHRRRSRLLKTGFFKKVRKLKIERKNPGQCFTYR
jgi:hypothetical protein